MSIHSFAHSYRDGGLFGIYAGTGEEEAAELMPVLCDEAMQAADGLAPVELARAKAQMKAGLLMSLESTGARCEQMARQLQVYGRIIPIAGDDGEDQRGHRRCCRATAACSRRADPGDLAARVPTLGATGAAWVVKGPARQGRLRCRIGPRTNRRWRRRGLG